MSGIEVKLTKFTPPRKANPFDGVVAQIAEAERDTAGEISVPKEVAQLSTAQTKIREAAKAIGLRARIRKVDEENRVITVTLHDKKSPDATAEGDEAADVSAEG